MNLLLLEDSQTDIDACLSSVDTFNDDHGNDLHISVAKDIDNAKSLLNDEPFDGAIIDLRIKSDSQAGNTLINFINNLNLRTPVALFTGTPDAASKAFSYIGVFKKGEKLYKDIFEIFYAVKQTGLQKIMGRKGIIEECLNKVFQKDIIPSIIQWNALASQYPLDVERALCRYTLSHLFLSLSNDSESYFPEECYLHIDACQFPRSGEIVMKNDSEDLFAIITPPCDLAVRQDKNKRYYVNVDDIQIIPLVSIEDMKHKIAERSSSKKDIDKQWEKICNNNLERYYHFLPPTNDFPGGFLNFRNVTSISLKKEYSLFSSKHLLISSDFFKDILSRFSSYYARQGQPEIRYLKNKL